MSGVLTESEPILGQSTGGRWAAQWTVLSPPASCRKWQPRQDKEKHNKMRSTLSRGRHIALGVLVGAIAGGIAVVLATGAIPKMMSRMMEKMRAQMGEGG